MKLGISMNLSRTVPEEWARRHKELGLSAVVFPRAHTAPIGEIDACVAAAKEFGLHIAEVGSWKNLLSPDKATREENFAHCLHQLELAEYVGADCCVNISGARGEQWDGAYPENYAPETYETIITDIRELLDRVKPQKTAYTLEPMPWMHPDSPEDYLQMIRDVDRPGFAVHMDMVNMVCTPERYLFSADFTRRAFALLGPYVKSCHLKDVALSPKLTFQLAEVPCGEGGFDIAAYIREAEQVNPDMPMIIEHLRSEEAYLKAIAYIKQLTEKE